MREITFRGKRKDNNEWVHGSLTIEYDGTCNINRWVDTLIEPENNYWEPVHERYEVISETVDQLAGPKDKTGISIYEGDILKTPCGGSGEEYNYTKVVFKPDIASWVKMNKDKKTFVRLEIRIDEVEVVGTIHENPELLQSL